MKKKITIAATTAAFIASVFVLPLVSSAQTLNTNTENLNSFLKVRPPISVRGLGMDEEKNEINSDTTERNEKEDFAKGHKGIGMRGRMIMGTVSAITGTTITLTGQNGTTYTIDAKSATLMDGGPGSTLGISNIQVGDKIAVHGTITGTNVVAKNIKDVSLIGRVIFPGKITAINGTTITITGKNSTSYSVNIAGATITKGGLKNTPTLTIADLTVGDNILAVGTLSGTTVTATRVQVAGQRGMHRSDRSGNHR